MNKEVAIYLAGVIDSDGTVTISITLSRAKNPSIIFTPQIRFGWKDSYDKHIIKLRDEIGAGKIYYSNKGKPEGMCFYQTTNISDAIYVCENIIPYLTVKKERAKQFLKIANFWKKTMPKNKGRRKEGMRLRTKEQITKMVKVALNLNYDRQVVRYREKKGWDYWSKTIDRLYS